VSYRIAVQPDLLPENSYSDRWIPRLQALGHEVRIVSVADHDFVEQVHDCDAFLWWFPPIPRAREVGKRVLGALDHAGRIVVHPDLRSCWHFDDKIAQAYLLKATALPTPRTWMLWRYDLALEFFRTATFPLVAKLAAGVRSQNVQLLRNEGEARRMARRLFGVGAESLHPRPLAFARKVLRPLRSAMQLALGFGPLPRPEEHRGYMIVQEFIAGNEYDTRITVIGNRAFAFRRANRPNDFRASGSHLKDDDPAGIHLPSVRLAFEASRALRMPALCFDILLRGGEPLITELSYYFNAPSIRECPGHWRMNGDELEWVSGSTHAEDAVLDDFLVRLAIERPTSIRNKI